MTFVLQTDVPIQCYTDSVSVLEHFENLMQNCLEHHFSICAGNNTDFSILCDVFLNVSIKLYWLQCRF